MYSIKGRYIMNSNYNFETEFNNLKFSIKNYCIGNEIAKCRIKSGLDKFQTAQYLNISVTELNQYENGEKEIFPEHLYMLSKLFNVNIDIFFSSLNSFDLK